MQCANHPEREGNWVCMKRQARLCDECAVCLQPETHCKHRTECIIWATRKQTDSWIEPESAGKRDTSPDTDNVSSRLKEITERINELKSRLPAHSAPAHMMIQLEDLEDQLDELLKRSRGLSGNNGNSNSSVIQQ